MARRSEPRFRFAPPIYPATERLPHRPKLSLFPLWTKHYFTAASDSIEMLLEIKPCEVRREGSQHEASQDSLHSALSRVPCHRLLKRRSKRTPATTMATANTAKPAPPTTPMS